MRALYLYFAGPADPSSGSRPARRDGRPADEPLVPIQPGAYSRWMANRARVVADNAAAYRRAVAASPERRRPRPEAAR